MRDPHIIAILFGVIQSDSLSPLQEDTYGFASHRLCAFGMSVEFGIVRLFWRRCKLIFCPKLPALEILDIVNSNFEKQIGYLYTSQLDTLNVGPFMSANVLGDYLAHMFVQTCFRDPLSATCVRM